MLNYLFGFLIIISGLFYFYFKTRQFRTTYVLPIRKKMYASIASTFLGSLLLSFGLNQLVLLNRPITYIIAGIFILLGLFVIVFNYRAYSHYKQFIEEEASLNEH